MGISFERDRDIPIGTQLEWGLRSAIVRGALAPGERLPPLRDLADEVGAHLNTIRSVYGRLEQDGLIETHQGKGSFVRAQPEGSSLAGAIEQAARLAHEAGVTPVELASALYVTPQAGGPRPRARGAARPARADRGTRAHARRALRQGAAPAGTRPRPAGRREPAHSHPGRAARAARRGDRAHRRGARSAHANRRCPQAPCGREAGIGTRRRSRAAPHSTGRNRAGVGARRDRDISRVPFVGERGT